MHRIIIFIITVLIYLSAVAASEETNHIIAVATDSQDLTGRLGTLADVSPYYQIYDSSGNLLEVLENPYSDQFNEDGTAVVHLLAEHGVTIIAARFFGYDMFREMELLSIGYCKCDGRIEDAVRMALDRYDAE